MSDQTEGRLLDEVESKNWLSQAGIPVVPTRPAKTLKQALEIAAEMGYPVALKIISPDIVHKSDAGGVKLNITNAAHLRRTYREMLNKITGGFPRAHISGVSVQKMARPGLELILGMNLDSQFGPVIMFGLGGILVELYKDVTFRLVPVKAKDAAEMVREIKAFPLLQGYRGSEPVNLPLLEKLIIDLSAFIEKNPNIQELDLNPVYGYADGLLAVDARIVVKK